MRAYLLIFLSFSLLGCAGKLKGLSEMSVDYVTHVESLKSASINGQTLKYIDEGQGEVFLLVHGIPTNSWMYRKIIKELSKKYRVIAPDLIGFGQSSKPKGGLHVKEQAAILKRFIKEHIKVKEFNLMVHDFGGVVGLMTVHLGGFKINKAVVLNTFFFDEGWHNGYNAMNKTANVVLPEMMTKAFFTSGVNKMFSSKMPKDVVEGYVRPLRDHNGTESYSCLYSSIPEVKEKILPVVQKTLLKAFDPEKIKVIWGKKDVFLDSKDQVFQIVKALRIKDENILILKKGKHLVADENAKEILSFIDM